MNKKNNTLLVSISAFLFAVFIALIILLFIGKNPITFLITLVTAFFNDRNGTLITSFLSRIVPLIFASIGVSFAFRTGLFNIGAEGQVSMGVFGAVLVGIIPGIPPGLHLILVILSAFVFGAIWGFLPGLLKAYFGVHEVVITIMMNYISLHLLRGYLMPLFADPEKIHQTLPLQESATFRRTFENFSFLRVPLNYWLFLIIGLLAIALFAFIINKTVFGFELRAGGFNKDAADYAGMKSKRNIILSMVISGGFAGIGGAFFILTSITTATNGFSQTGYGFDGLAAALLGGSTPIGSLIGSGVLGYLSAVSTKLQQLVGIPKEITEMIVALILFFIAMSYLFELSWTKILRKKVETKKTNDVTNAGGEV